MAQLRERLADVLNTVAYAGSDIPIVYLTRLGRRIAAILPSDTAEDLEEMVARRHIDSATSELA